MRLSLRRFLQTGVFGSLHLGATKQETRDLLGPPDGYGGTSRKYRWPSIWQYGDAQLGVGHSREGAVWYVRVEPSMAARFIFAGDWTVEDWGLTPAMPRQAAERCLSENGLGYREPDDSRGIVMVHPSGVELAFLSQEDIVAHFIGAGEAGTYVPVPDGLWTISLVEGARG